MIHRQEILKIGLPLLVLLVALGLWAGVTSIRIHGQPWIPPYDVPSPLVVMQGAPDELHTGRLVSGAITSLFRVAVGFGMAVLLGVPLGLLMGSRPLIRTALLPGVNFFRCLSPLAWIPFSIIWFGVGDAPAIFLIFMASFFPMALATMAAVANIPAVQFRVARDYGFRGWDLLTHVTLPAIMPQIITALRVTAGIAWVVIVAAEMVGCKDGLGFGISDANNALRLDLVVLYMIAIGLLGMALDRLLMQLTRLPSVRWGYER
jgi:NitT/TauT family transport system permease protein